MHAEIGSDRRDRGDVARGHRRAHAGPWEDGMVAYNRGDYLPAIRLFRPLAEQGNPKAQNQIGLMYRKGEGVIRRARPAPSCGSALPPNAAMPRRRPACVTSPGRMTPGEISQAQQMAQACEASNYRACEY